MNCTIKNIFESQFKTPLEKRSKIEESEKLILHKWVIDFNNKVKAEGFDRKVFDVDFSQRQTSSVNVKGSNFTTDYILLYDEQSAKEYDAFQYAEDARYAREQMEEELSWKAEQGTLFAPDDAHLEDFNEYHTTQNDLEYTEKPGNFIEWKNNRLKLKEDLERQATKYRKQNNKLKLKLTNKAIKEIDKQLNKFDENDIEIVHEKLIQEIGVLEDFLDSVNENSIDAAASLEANKIIDRINDLFIYFIGEDLMTKDYSENLTTLLKNTFDKDKFNDVQNRIREIERQYRLKSSQIIESIFKNDSLLHEHKRTMGKDEYEAFYERGMEVLKANKQHVDMVTGEVLGAGQIDSLVANLLISLRDSNHIKEVGLTQQLVNDLKDAWLKVKDTELNGKRIVLKLFQKDLCGVRTNKLITPYTGGFYKLLSDVGSLKYNFYKNRNKETYKNWMNIAKNNFDSIQPYKIKSFYDLYKDHELFKEYFTDSVEDMEKYEQELRSKLGKTLFEMELEKQKQAIADFVYDQENNMFASVYDKYNKNPFAFVKNFYSDNYNKYDQSTAEYLEPNFVRFIPKNDNHFNEELKKIEGGEKGQELMEVWKSSYKLLTEYVNPSLQAEGVNVSLNELMNQRDVLDSENIKDMSFFKKASKLMGVIHQNWKEDFGKNKDLQEVFENRLKNAKNESERKEILKEQKDIKVNYSSYGDNVRRVWRDYFKSKSLNEIISIAKKEGLDVSTVSNIENKKQKELLIDSLIQAKINKSSSTNLFSSVVDAVSIVRNGNTRRNTQSTASAMKTYLEQSEDKTNLKYVQDWEAINVTGNTFLDRAWKFWGINIGDLKLYTEAEKDLKNLLTTEKSGNTFNFTFNGTEYSTENGKYYKREAKETTKKELSKKEVKIAHNKYTKDILDKLGRNIQLGSFVLGLKSNFTRAALTFLNIGSGGMNRMDNLAQLMSAGASGEYGFNTEDVIAVRRFMRWDNTLKVLSYTGLPQLFGYSESNRLKTTETIRMLMTNLHIFNNLMDEAKIEGAFGTNRSLEKLKTMMSDVAVNLPEWKNQTGVFLCLARNVMIPTVNKDANGKTIMRRLFDKDGLIYIPGTLKLKDEFDTIDNQLNWEQFKENTEGYSPQNLLVAKTKHAQAGLNGNYSVDDKTRVDGTISGKIASMFKKWFFGNAHRQYGKKELEIRTGKIDYLGNKRELFKHGPAAFGYTVMANGGVNRAMTAVQGAIFASGAVASGAAMLATGGISLIGIGALLWANRKTVSHSFNKQECRLALNLARETAIRTINVVPKYFLYKEVVSEETINSLKYSPSGMTKDQRGALSACAEDVATKFAVFIGAGIAEVTIMALYALAASSEDDDDEKKYKIMAEAEGKINWLMNLKSSAYENIEKWTNPASFYEAGTPIAFLKHITRTEEKLIGVLSDKNTIFEDMIEGKKSLAKGLTEVAAESATVVGFPRSATELISGESLIEDDRLYSKGDWFDAVIDNKAKDPERNYKEATSARRKMYSEDVKSKIREIYSDKGTDLDEETVSELARIFMQKNDLYKDRKGTYEDLYNSDSWENVDDAIENMNEYDLQKERRKEKESDEFSAE